MPLGGGRPILDEPTTVKSSARKGRVATGARDSSAPAPLTAKAASCRRKFLRFFPGGFTDETYLDWERSYKAEAHARWVGELGQPVFSDLLAARAFEEIAARAIRIESRTNLLFSFEKMALRDAVRTRPGARRFAESLFEVLHGRARPADRFTEWCAAVETLPRRQTRVLTWPIVTVFLFLGEPDRHVFLKPNVTRVAAAAYGFDFRYQPRPNWHTYSEFQALASTVRRDLRDLRPRDMIDIQSFLWVQGSDEYRGRMFQPARTTRVRR